MVRKIVLQEENMNLYVKKNGRHEITNYFMHDEILKQANNMVVKSGLFDKDETCIVKFGGLFERAQRDVEILEFRKDEFEAFTRFGTPSQYKGIKNQLGLGKVKVTSKPARDGNRVLESVEVTLELDDSIEKVLRTCNPRACGD